LAGKIKTKLLKTKLFKLFYIGFQFFPCRINVSCVMIAPQLSQSFSLSQKKKIALADAKIGNPARDTRADLGVSEKVGGGGAL